MEYDQLREDKEQAAREAGPIKATERSLINCCGYKMDYLGRSQYRCRICDFDLDYS